MVEILEMSGETGFSLVLLYVNGSLPDNNDNDKITSQM